MSAGKRLAVRIEFALLVDDETTKADLPWLGKDLVLAGVEKLMRDRAITAPVQFLGAFKCRATDDGPVFTLPSLIAGQPEPRGKTKRKAGAR